MVKDNIRMIELHNDTSSLEPANQLLYFEESANTLENITANVHITVNCDRMDIRNHTRLTNTRLKGAKKLYLYKIRRIT